MKQIEIKYIRADKTIEKYMTFNGKIIFIYNNQGLYFDVFFSKNKMEAFFDNKISRGDLFFDNEKSLNEYFDFNLK
ncbi:MAG: hypothetical protein L3J74_15770 [Bacteroidales bacterium]|nr:hypothetical protein [Bacteroidales bacterium]